MIIRILLSLIFALGLSSQVWACSCAQNQTMGQIVESGAIAILASPVGTEIETEWGRWVYPTRLKVWTTFSGKSKEYETISLSGSSCSLAIPTNQTSLIIARRNKAGSLSTSLCTDGGFSKDQWFLFFESGDETPPRERCYMKIKAAYDAVIFLGKFELDDPKCEVHIPGYDAQFGVRVKSNSR